MGNIVDKANLMANRAYLLNKGARLISRSVRLIAEKEQTNSFLAPLFMLLLLSSFLLISL